MYYLKPASVASILLVVASIACLVTSSPIQAPPITQVIQVTQIIPVAQATLSSENVSCEKVDGVYYRPEDKVFMTIAQTGCVIIGTINASAFDHTLEGNWSSSGYYYFTMKRHNKSNGCVTEMFGQLSKLQNGNIQFLINGTDGRCELLSSYTEVSVWIRQ